MIYLYLILAVLVLLAECVVAIPRENQRKALLRTIREEAAPYEQAVRQLYYDITVHRRYLIENAKLQKGVALMAYQLSSPEDLDFVTELARQNRFEPVIVLNCARSWEDLTALLAAVRERLPGSGIILTARPLNLKAAQTAGWLSAQIENPAFLLRGDNDNEETRAFLAQTGCSRFVFYDRQGANGITEAGEPYLSYSFINNRNILIEGTSDVMIRNDVAMAVVFDLEAVDLKLIDKDRISMWTRHFASYVRRGMMEFGQYETTFQGVAERAARSVSFHGDYMTYMKEKMKEVKKLEAEIDRLYEPLNQFDQRYLH